MKFILVGFLCSFVYSTKKPIVKNLLLDQIHFENNNENKLIISIRGPQDGRSSSPPSERQEDGKDINFRKFPRRPRISTSCGGLISIRIREIRCIKLKQNSDADFLDMLNWACHYQKFQLTSDTKFLKLPFQSYAKQKLRIMKKQKFKPRTNN